MTDDIDQHLKYHGSDAVVRNFEVVGTDEYGDDIRESTEIETKVVVDRSPATRIAGEIEESELGIDPRIEAIVMIDPSVEVRDTSGDSPPSELDVHGHTYQVLAIDNREWYVDRLFVSRA